MLIQSTSSAETERLLGPRGVHRGEHTLHAGLFHATDAVDGAFGRLLAGRVHRVLKLDVAGGDEDVYHLDSGVQRCLDVLVDDAGQSTRRRLRRRSDVSDCLELGVRVHGEARLDDVRPHRVE
jgi:hypothetical protein